MMILDLVSPWTTAVQANDESGLTSFRQLHAPLLDQLHNSQTPEHHFLMLTENPLMLNLLQQRVVLEAFQQPLIDTVIRAVDLGANLPVTVVLLPIEDHHEIPPLIAQHECSAILALNTDTMAAWQLQIQLARALASITRWHASDSSSALRCVDGHFDHWELARTVALKEWVYSAGVGWHLAQALFPALPVHRLFGMGASAWQRLREQEHLAREMLNRELDQRGIGLIMKWLRPTTSRVRRHGDQEQLDPKMGQYLAWRMTAQRVSRMGIHAALRETS